MQIEVRRIQRQMGVTTLMVTHDQEEAISISDRIAVINHGRIVQFGTPDEIYDRPAERFVGDFVGSMNMIPAELVATEGKLTRFRNRRLLRTLCDLAGPGCEARSCPACHTAGELDCQVARSERY